LWLFILWTAVRDRCSHTPEEFLAHFEGQSEVRLDWDLDENDDDLALVSLSVDGQFIADAEWERFFSETLWEAYPTHWLLHELSVDPSQVRQVLRRALP
jgi:hypothetical protein